MINAFIKAGLWILKLFGWQRLLDLAWQLVKPELEKAALKTPSQFDDRLVAMLDEIETTIVNAKETARIMNNGGAYGR